MIFTRGVKSLLVCGWMRRESAQCPAPSNDDYPRPTGQGQGPGQRETDTPTLKEAEAEAEEAEARWRGGMEAWRRHGMGSMGG